MTLATKAPFRRFPSAPSISSLQLTVSPCLADWGTVYFRGALVVGSETSTRPQDGSRDRVTGSSVLLDGSPVYNIEEPAATRGRPHFRAHGLVAHERGLPVVGRGVAVRIVHPPIPVGVGIHEDVVLEVRRLEAAHDGVGAGNADVALRNECPVWGTRRAPRRGD